MLYCKISKRNFNLNDSVYNILCVFFKITNRFITNKEIHLTVVNLKDSLSFIRSFIKLLERKRNFYFILSCILMLTSFVTSSSALDIWFHQQKNICPSISLNFDAILICEEERGQTFARSCISYQNIFDERYHFGRKVAFYSKF